MKTQQPVIPGDARTVATWVREMSAPVIPGIEMNGIGNWSCPRLKLFGFSTRQKLMNAINRKQKA